MATPALAIVGGMAIALATGPAATLGLLLRTEGVISVLVLNLAFGVYHLAAIADAWRLAVPRPYREGAISRRAHVTLGGVVAGTILLHGSIGLAGYQALETLDRVDGTDAGEVERLSGLADESIGPISEIRKSESRSRASTPAGSQELTGGPPVISHVESGRSPLR